MSGTNTKRLSKVAKEFNVGTSTIVDFLRKQGFDVESNPNTKVSAECYDALVREYRNDFEIRKEKEKISQRNLKARKEVNTENQEDVTANDDDEPIIIIQNSNGVAEREQIESEKHKITQKDKSGLKIVGKIELEKKKKITSEDKAVDIVKDIATENLEEDKKDIHTTNETIKDNKNEPTDVTSDASNQKVETKPEENTQQNKEKIESKSIDNQKDKSSADETKISIKDNSTQIITNNKKSNKTENEVKVIGKIDLNSINQRTRPKRKTKEEKKDERIKKEREKRELREKEKLARRKAGEKKNQSYNNRNQQQNDNTNNRDDEAFIKTKVKKLSAPTVLGKIELPKHAKVEGSSSDNKKNNQNKKRRRRIPKEPVNLDAKNNNTNFNANKQKNKPKRYKKNQKVEIDDTEVQKKIRETLAKLTAPKGKNRGSRHRRDRRDELKSKLRNELAEQAIEKQIIKVTEFVTANELAAMMDISVNEVIKSCMNLGMFVSINERLDAETIALLVEDFGFQVEFVSVDLQEAIAEEKDAEEDLLPRAPIVTVMGHVDHGKTSLLDYIRNENIIAGEAGGITQHIGAYNVTLADGKRITFLDTPGHEAFTAMRARGARVTDLAIIVVAADDKVMPQTIEAINHASAAGVPIIFAINKIDRPNANPEKIKEELANKNYLVEEWGGKYQSKDISAKFGNNVDELMEEVFLAAEMLELKANPNRNAIGTIVESSLDKGRGFVSTVLVSNGTLRVGDIVLAGSYYGRVKAIYNERDKLIEKLGPSEPGVILGLNGAPRAGDNINVMESDRKAREIAVKREQLQREQNLRSQKHITLDEIGRRLAIGNFQELNIIVKGDVDGSIEALSDSLLKLSTDEIQVNIIHKAVGQIAESDVMLATASDAIIIGFQVRPSIGARRMAEKDGIEIRLYSIIYDAINEVKDSISGMLAPNTKEEIIAVVEVKETFKITKVGTIAGCIVRDGKISKNSQVRIIRDGIVVYTSTLGSLKRFKDDVKEVAKGLECGLNIDKYNDIKVGDMIEAFEIIELAK